MYPKCAAVGAASLLFWLYLQTVSAQTATQSLFTQPPWLEFSRQGDIVNVDDLSYAYAIGDKVQLSWQASMVTFLSLQLIYWGGDRDGDVIRVFLTNQANRGYYTWYVGTDDNITPDHVEKYPNHALVLVALRNSSALDEGGWIGTQIMSRGFVLKSNATQSQPSATTSSAASTSAGSTSPPSTGEQECDQNQTAGLGGGPVAGIAIGAAFAGALLVSVGSCLFKRRRDRGGKPGMNGGNSSVTRVNRAN